MTTEEAVGLCMRATTGAKRTGRSRASERNHIRAAIVRRRDNNRILRYNFTYTKRTVMKSVAVMENGYDCTKAKTSQDWYACTGHFMRFFFYLFFNF